ncbi:hypothetical protein ACFX1S_041431 [Malus domestica]
MTMYAIMIISRGPIESTLPERSVHGWSSGCLPGRYWRGSSSSLGPLGYWARVGWNGTAWACGPWAVVLALWVWALSKVAMATAVVVATMVATTVAPSGGGASALVVALSLVDRRGPNS